MILDNLIIDRYVPKIWETEDTLSVSQESTCNCTAIKRDSVYTDTTTNVETVYEGACSNPAFDPKFMVIEYTMPPISSHF